MISRFPSQGFSSFISFYACARQQSKHGCRTFSAYRPRCAKHHPLNAQSQHAQKHKTRAKVSFLFQCPMCHSKGASLQRVFHTSTSLSAGTKNPYNVIGVAKDASPAEIKKSYFAVCPHFPRVRMSSSVSGNSLHASIIQTQTLTKMHKPSLWRYRRLMTYVLDLQISLSIRLVFLDTKRRQKASCI
jgi:hypothetical protein